MRNTFVVLVSLCIGVVSGFIVPSSAPELPSDWNDSTTESVSDVTSDANATSYTSKYTVLPKSRNDIDEKDLYEHATERQNNQSERAFIYINQRFKKPVRNRLFKISQLDQKIVYPTVPPPPPTVPSLATPCPVTSRASPYSYFQGFDLNDKLPQEMASYFADPTAFRCKDNDKNSHNNNMNSNNNNINTNNNNNINSNNNNINSINNNINPNYNNKNSDYNNINPNYINKIPDYNNKNPDYNNKNSDYNNKNFNYNNKIISDTSPIKLPPQPLRMDEQREYFELLKPPIVRPMNQPNTKTNYESILQNGFVSLSPSSIPFKDNFLRTYNLKAPYVANPKVSFKQPEEIRNKNYGFDDVYIRHPFQSKDLINRVEDVNFEADFVNDDDTRRLYETNNQEDDKLLDKYLKDTLEEQNVPDCSYRECILQSAKPPTNAGRLLKPDCKCGKRLNIKHVDPFLVKDRALREESKHNDTDTHISSEINYYEEMLSEDVNLMKPDDDVVRPPNKANETSAL